MIGKIFSILTQHRTPDRGKSPQLTTARPIVTATGIKPAPSRLVLPQVTHARGHAMSAAFTLHGSNPTTTAFAPATRTAYAPRALYLTRKHFFTTPCPPQEVKITTANGDVAYRYKGIPAGSGATCNFYRAENAAGHPIAVLEYRLGNRVIAGGPNARSRIDVASIERQTRITRRACPQLEVQPPVVVDDVVYVGVKLMDVSLRDVVVALQHEEMTQAEHLAFVRCCMRQLLEGLAYAYETGVSHRDIKPDNILMDREALCLVSDWGQAHCEGEDNTRLGGGTPRYAAPERTAKDVEGHLRADMFSVGITIAELLGADVSGLPGAGTGSHHDFTPDNLLEQWFASRTDGQGHVNWQTVHARAEDRREEFLLRTIDAFALEARDGDRALSDYLFMHLLRFDKNARHTPREALAWMAKNYPDAATDLASTRQVMPRLLPPEPL